MSKQQNNNKHSKESFKKASTQNFSEKRSKGKNEFSFYCFIIKIKLLVKILTKSIPKLKKQTKTIFNPIKFKDKVVNIFYLSDSVIFIRSYPSLVENRRKI